MKQLQAGLLPKKAALQWSLKPLSLTRLDQVMIGTQVNVGVSNETGVYFNGFKNPKSQGTCCYGSLSVISHWCVSSLSSNCLCLSVSSLYVSSFPWLFCSRPSLQSVLSLSCLNVFYWSLLSL